MKHLHQQTRDPLQYSMAQHRRWVARGIEDAQDGDGDEAAEAEEAFRMGLQRNILHLSNVVRAQQDELVTLRAQLKTQDDQQKCLEDKIKLYQARVKTQPSPPPATDFGRSQRFMRYGQLAVVAGRLAGGSRPAACQETETPEASVEEQAKNSGATVAEGESQTMRHLLGVNRDLRSQLARAEKQAESFLQFSGRVNLLEDEKRQLQSRLELMEDQLKLQAAPLAALQLELNQARLDTESMRIRLKEDRKDARRRQEDTEKKQSKLDALAKDLRSDLEDAQRAYQRESNKVDKYARLYNKAMSETERVTEQLKQSIADARIMAHELVRMKDEIDRKSRRPHVSTQTSPTSDEESGDNAPSSVLSSAENPKGDVISGKADKEGEIGQETQASNSTEAQVVSLEAQLKQLQGRLEDAERATGEARDREERVKAELVHMKHEKAELVSTAETSGARREHLCTDVDEGRKKRRLSTMRAELCRTIDEMRSAEDAVKVSLTCLSCTRLLRNPHIITPCGHTLCGDCCGRHDGDFDEGVLKKGTGTGAALEGQGDSMKRVRAVCCLCEREGDGAEDESQSGASSQWTMTPNRAVAALVGKFTFRRQCLEVLSRLGQALWEEAVAPARSGA